MKIKALVFLTAFLVSQVTLNAQASWGYSIWFNLSDIDGETFNIQDFKSGKVKLLSNAFGAHSKSSLTYDTLSNSLKFSQHTASTNAVLAFVNKGDTTTISLNTNHLYIDMISLTGKTYAVHSWGKKHEMQCDIELPGYDILTICKNKFPFASYAIKPEDLSGYHKLTEVLYR